MYNKIDFYLKDFLNTLADSESGTGSGTGGQYNYNITNSIGALGKYQFMPQTIISLANKYGLRIKLGQDFLNDHMYQELLASTFVSDLLDSINNLGIDIYLGQSITGQKNNITAPITIYGLVAGGWLGGEPGLKDYFINNIDHYDGNTYISDYIAKFSSFEIGSKKKSDGSSGISFDNIQLDNFKTLINNSIDNLQSLSKFISLKK